MKKILAIITLAALALPSFAQFIPGPHVGAAITCPSTGFELPAAAAGTNIATAGYAPMFSLTGDDTPVYLYWEYSSTNAANGLSNIVCFVQYSVDGNRWMGPAALAGSHVTLASAQPGPGGTTPKVYPLLTSLKANIGVQPSLIYATNLAAWRYIRLQILSNNTPGDQTNKFYITNCWFIQR